MDEAFADQLTIMFLTTMEERQRLALARVRAALQCAKGGDRSGAVSIALEVELLAYETGTLLNAMSLVGGLASG